MDGNSRTTTRRVSDGPSSVSVRPALASARPPNFSISLGVTAKYFLYCS